MKYRTVIELTCDAVDADDAIHTAGEYLKGEVDFGVAMKCNAVSFRAHRIRKYATVCIVASLMCTTFLLKVTPIGTDQKVSGLKNLGFNGTCTVTPALKTKHKSNFKEEWAKKKDEAVLQYIKN